MRWTLPGLILLTLVACTPFSAEIKPQEWIDPPQSYSTVGHETVSDRWWQRFAAPDLNHLIDEALRDNLTLRQAWARLYQAQRLSQQSHSSSRPDLTLGADHNNSRTRSSGSTTNDETFSLSLRSSFELDLWGRVAAQIESQQKDELATGEDLQTAAISLTAEVTGTWLSLLTQIGQQQLLEEQLQTSQQYLKLIDLRFRKSQSTALDLLLQQESIAALQTKLPAMQKQEQLLRHELALLLGNNPREPLKLTQFELPQLQPLPELGLPADLLQQRPDIRAAALRLQAADLDLTVAQADRLPALTLSASATTSGDFSDLFDNWLLNLAQSLTAPLLDGSNRKAEVERQKAIIYEELAAYQQTVLTAIREVEDALISEQKLLEERHALQHQRQIAEKALATAKNRYLRGQSTYLPVLTELQSVEQLQQDLLTQQRDLLSNRVSLHRALGGDWSKQLPVQPLEVTL